MTNRNSYSWYQSQIISIFNLTHNVKQLVVRISNEGRSFSFIAGQYINLKIPGIDIITGYTITSTFDYFQRTGCIKLAVKYSDYAPTKWLHSHNVIDTLENGTLNDEKLLIQTSVGGTIFIDKLISLNSPNGKIVPRKIVFIASGIGITPTISMISTLINSPRTDNEKILKEVQLFQCAQHREDLLFEKEFIEMVSSSFIKFKINWFVTRERADDITAASLTEGACWTFGRRMNQGDLVEVGEALHCEAAALLAGETGEGGIQGIAVHICGPDQFIKDCQMFLLESTSPPPESESESEEITEKAGEEREERQKFLLEERIFFEKWS